MNENSLSKTLQWNTSVTLPESERITNKSFGTQELATLFESQKDAELRKMALEVPNKKYLDLRSICMMINNLFKNNCQSLSLFFYAINKNKKVCLQTFTGFPALSLQLINKQQNHIAIRGQRVGAKFEQIGWHNINDVESIQPKLEHLTTVMISNMWYVKKINVWRWGFQVISDMNYNMVACLSYALVDKDIGKDLEWNLPVRESIKNDQQFNQIVSSWEYIPDTKDC